MFARGGASILEKQEDCMKIGRWILLPVIALSCMNMSCSTSQPYGADVEPASDSEVVSDLSDRLREDTITSRFTFGVSVANGEATLTGYVPDQNARMRALGIADGTPGVQSVLDRMRR